MAIDRMAYVAWVVDLGLSELEANRDADLVMRRGDYLADLVKEREDELAAAKALAKEHTKLLLKPEGWMVIARRYANSEISAQPIG